VAARPLAVAESAPSGKSGRGGPRGSDHAMPSIHHKTSAPAAAKAIRSIKSAMSVPFAVENV